MPGELDLVARLLAFEGGRAVRIASRLQVSIQPDALVLCPLAMSGEDTTIHAVAVGRVGGTAEFRSVPDPRFRDDQFGLFAWLGESRSLFGVFIGSTVHEVAQVVAIGNAIGGEAAHGVIILSPKAVRRMEEQNSKITWPVPKIFRLVDEKKLLPGELEYSTINTPSMLCVEDAIDALKWAETVGGLAGLVKRSTANLAAFEKWVEKSSWISFLAETKETRSNTSVCFKIKAEWFQKLGDEDKTKAAKKITSLLDKEGVAKDINSYGKAPAGIRVWCGATVETSDIEALIPWLDWAYEQVAKEYSKEAVK